MGIFSDKCPRCGYRVKKSAQVCSSCGLPAPGGMTKCARCGTKVGTDSKYCWSCGCEMATFERAMAVNNTWARLPGDLAGMIYPGELKGWLSKTLYVKEGTSAALFQMGRLKTVLRPGAHTFTTFMNRFHDYDFGTPTMALLFDPSDVVLEFDVNDLFTKDDQTVNGKIMLVTNIEKPDFLYRNYMKDRQMLKTRDVEEYLSDEIRSVLKNIVNQQTMESLYSTIEIRDDIQVEISDKLGATLSRAGFRVVHVKFIDFHSEAYDNLRRQKGDAAMLEEEVRAQKRVYEAIRTRKIAEFASEQDFVEFVNQARHEEGVKGAMREQEIAALKQAWELKRRDREREEALKEAETEDRVERIHDKRVEEKQEKQLELMLKLKEGKWKLKKEQIETLRGMTADEVLAHTGDPEQLARVLEARYKSMGTLEDEKAKLLQQHIEDIKAMSEKDKDRLTELTKQTLEQMARLGENKPGPNII